MLRPFIASVLAAATILLCAYGWLAMSTPAHAAECVTASWYGPESGNRTANGEHFDGSSMTAAHRSLPFGTKLRVTYRGQERRSADQ